MWLFGRAGVRDLQSLELKIANSKVMGAAAVTTTAAFAAIAGLAQLLGWESSERLSEFGGWKLDTLWAGALVVAGGFILAARVREKKDPIDGAWLEVGGCGILAVSIAVYIASIVKLGGGLDGRLFVVLMLSSTALNVVGRAILLIRRIVWIWRASR